MGAHFAIRYLAVWIISLRRKGGIQREPVALIYRSLCVYFVIEMRSICIAVCAFYWVCHSYEFCSLKKSFIVVSRANDVEYVYKEMEQKQSKEKTSQRERKMPKNRTSTHSAKQNIHSLDKINCIHCNSTKIGCIFILANFAFHGEKKRDWACFVFAELVLVCKTDQDEGQSSYKQLQSTYCCACISAVSFELFTLRPKECFCQTRWHNICRNTSLQDCKN